MVGFGCGFSSLLGRVLWVGRLPNTFVFNEAYFFLLVENRNYYEPFVSAQSSKLRYTIVCISRNGILFKPNLLIGMA